MKLTEETWEKFVSLIREQSDGDASLEKVKSEIRKELSKVLSPLSTSPIQAPHKPHEGRRKNDVRLWLKNDLYKNVPVGDPKTTRDILNKEIDKLKKQGKIPAGLEFVRIAGKGDEASGSGRYPTFVYTFQHENKPEDFLIVNGVKPGRTVAIKEFTPNKILSPELLGKPYSEIDDVYEEVNSFVEEKGDSPKIRYISYLTDLASEHSPEIDLDEITTREEITVGKLKDPVDDLDDYDKEEVLKDFGEIFTGLVLGESGYLVGFPAEATARIIDLRAKQGGDKTDIGIGVSVKLRAGASPSVPGIHDRISDLENQDPGVLDDFRATEIFEIINEYHTVSYVLKLSSYLAGVPEADFSESWDHFKKFVEKWGDKEKLNKIDLDNPPKKNVKELKAALDSVLENLEEEYSDSQITEMIEEFRKKVDAMSKLEPYTRKRGSKHGQLVFPMQSAIVKQLNKDEDLVDSIKTMLSKLAVKQFHLYRKSDGVDIKIVSYGTTSFSFQTGGSAPSPGQQKMRFKLATK
jgi:hypothetical protein